MGDNGERFALELDRYRPAAMRIAVRELGVREDAEDAVQDAMIAAWQSRATFDPERGSLKSWFFTIVDNACKMQKRRANGQGRARRPEIVSLDRADLPEPAAPDEPEALGIDWGACWDLLSARQREVLALSLDGYRVWEIARELRIGKDSVKQHLYRAKRKLRDHLQEEGKTWIR